VGQPSWREAIERSGLFTPIEERTTRFADELDADGLAERLGSISFVGSASALKRDGLERNLRELAAARGGHVRFAYRTRAYVAFSAG
jgi:hypothetical protein